MGLDFSHCDAHFSYMRFHAFRLKIMNQLKYPTFEDKRGIEGYAASCIPKKEPLRHFLLHSDCEGHITPKRCQNIISRLNEIIKDWPEDDLDKKICSRMIEGMKLAIANNENFEFW